MSLLCSSSLGIHQGLASRAQSVTAPQEALMRSLQAVNLIIVKLETVQHELF